MSGSSWITFIAASNSTELFRATNRRNQEYDAREKHDVTIAAAEFDRVVDDEDPIKAGRLPPVPTLIPKCDGRATEDL